MMPTARAIYLLLWVLSVGAIDIILKDAECDESLPIYLEDDSLSIECDGETRCSLGTELSLYGKLQFKGVNELGLMDGFTFISANLQLLSLEYQLLQYLQVPICGQYVVEDEGNDAECPYDGKYEFYMPYVLPDEQTKLSWLATGWEAVSEVRIYSEANNIDSLIGSCQIHLSTAVTPSENSILAQLPIPTAMITTVVILTFAGLMLLSCIYQLIRDVALGEKKKGDKRGLLEDSDDETQTTSNADFKKMET